MNETNEKHIHHHYHIGVRSSAYGTSVLNLIVIVLSVTVISFITAPLIFRWLQSPVEPLNAHVMLDAREIARVHQTPVDQLMRQVMKAHIALRNTAISEQLLKQPIDEDTQAIAVKKILRMQQQTQRALMNESRALDKLAYRLSHSKQNNHTQDRREAHDHP